MRKSCLINLSDNFFAVLGENQVKTAEKNQKLLVITNETVRKTCKK